MTATVLFSGVFLWVTSGVLVAAVLALRPYLLRLWDNVVDLVTCPPSEDVLTPCEEFERGRVFR